MYIFSTDSRECDPVAQHWNIHDWQPGGGGHGADVNNLHHCQTVLWSNVSNTRVFFSLSLLLLTYLSVELKYGERRTSTLNNFPASVDLFIQLQSFH